MQLFRTDSGLGYTFKDVQTSLALKDLLEDDQRRLHIHYLKHTNKKEKDGRVLYVCECGWYLHCIVNLADGEILYRDGMCDYVQSIS